MTTAAETTRLNLIPDHRERAERILLGRFRGRPRIEALVAAISCATQTAEELWFDLIVSRTITASTGAQLDQWGELVGEQRGPLTDDEYRVFIEARMLANRCNGTPDEIITIWDLVTGPNNGVFYQPIYPACFELWVARDEFVSDEVFRRIARIMDDIKPGGVCMILNEGLSGGLGFDDLNGFTGFDQGGFSRLITL